MNELLQQRIEELKQDEGTVLRRCAASIYWCIKNYSEYFHMPFEREAHPGQREEFYQVLKEFRAYNHSLVLPTAVKATLSALSTDEQEHLAMATEVEVGIVIAAEATWDGTQENYHQFLEEKENVSEAAFNCEGCYLGVAWLAIYRMSNPSGIDLGVVSHLAHHEDKDLRHGMRDTLSCSLDHVWERECKERPKTW